MADSLFLNSLSSSSSSKSTPTRSFDDGAVGLEIIAAMVKTAPPSPSPTLRIFATEVRMTENHQTQFSIQTANRKEMDMEIDSEESEEYTCVVSRVGGHTITKKFYCSNESDYYHDENAQLQVTNHPGNQCAYTNANSEQSERACPPIPISDGNWGILTDPQFEQSELPPLQTIPTSNENVLNLTDPQSEMREFLPPPNPGSNGNWHTFNNASSKERELSAPLPVSASTSNSKAAIFTIGSSMLPGLPGNFLTRCCFCKTSLLGIDIFMYRGEEGFCTPECRYLYVLTDEHRNICGTEVVKPSHYGIPRRGSAA